MPIANLLKSQSNEIYLAITEADWDVSCFQFYEENAGNTYDADYAKLIHKNSGFYFTFENDSDFISNFSPADDQLADELDFGNWINQIKFFRGWLSLLAREINAPDLWKELPNESKLIESASGDDDNSNFDAEEKKAIQKGLKEVKTYLVDSHNLDPKLIERQLKYLTESANRLGRKDWKNILISTMFGIIIQGGIAGHSAQEVFQFVWTVLSSVLIHQIYLP